VYQYSSLRKPPGSTLGIQKAFLSSERQIRAETRRKRSASTYDSQRLKAFEWNFCPDIMARLVPRRGIVQQSSTDLQDISLSTSHPQTFHLPMPLSQTCAHLMILPVVTKTGEHIFPNLTTSHPSSDLQQLITVLSSQTTAPLPTGVAQCIAIKQRLSSLEAARTRSLKASTQLS
jgi:hypothetical protein